MSLFRIHWIRFVGAILALLLALLSLAGFEKVSLAGFFFIAAYGAVVCILLQRGKLPGRCDLCGSNCVVKAEYDHGYTNTRLVLDCPNCGRVVNTATTGVTAKREKSGITAGNSNTSR